jgi:hypothetical protein
MDKPRLFVVRSFDHGSHLDMFIDLNKVSACRETADNSGDTLIICDGIEYIAKTELDTFIDWWKNGTSV